QSRDMYRFQLAVPAGQAATQDVVEERTRWQYTALGGLDDRTLVLYARSGAASPAVKQALEKAIQLRQKLADAQRSVAEVQRQLSAITTDQQRLRDNLKQVPNTSAAYKRYL